MHSELMLSPSPSTSGTKGKKIRPSGHYEEQRRVSMLKETPDPPVFLMGKSDLRCMVEGSSFMRSDSCRLKGEVF